jgi:hypothetical protein
MLEILIESIGSEQSFFLSRLEVELLKELLDLSVYELRLRVFLSGS